MTPKSDETTPTPRDMEYAPAIHGVQTYFCDCLPAGADGRPSDDADAIYKCRAVMLVVDVRQLLTEQRAVLVEALQALQEHAATQGWWLERHAIAVMDQARAALQQAGVDHED